MDESFPMLFGSIGLFSFPCAYENTVFDALETKKASPTEVEEAFIRVIPFGFEPKTYPPRRIALSWILIILFVD